MSVVASVGRGAQSAHEAQLSVGLRSVSYQLYAVQQRCAIEETDDNANARSRTKVSAISYKSDPRKSLSTLSCSLRECPSRVAQSASSAVKVARTVSSMMPLLASPKSPYFRLTWDRTSAQRVFAITLSCCVGLEAPEVYPKAPGLVGRKGASAVKCDDCKVDGFGVESSLDRLMRATVLSNRQSRMECAA